MATDVKIGNKTIFLTPTGMKEGSKGKVIPAGEMLGKLATKSERRKLRKFAHRNGYKGHAAARTA